MSGKRKKSKKGGHPARADARSKANVRQGAAPRPAVRSKGIRAASLLAPAQRPRTRRGGRRHPLPLSLPWGRVRTLVSAAEPTPVVGLTRVDYVWATAVALASAALFATVLTSYPGLSDSSEAVAGVSSLGILHAPGYPAYVLVAKLFTLLLPVGNEAFRVNLFSLVCAAFSVGAVHLLARRCGAARWAAALGAATLAISAGFWFYSGFAKHDMFSGAMFALSLNLLLAWHVNPRPWRLIVLAVALAVGLGSSWPLMLMIIPAVGFVLIRSHRDLTAKGLLAASAAGAVALAVVYGFVMVRAGQNPTLDWGHATTPSALVKLIRRADFAPPPASGPITHAPASLTSAAGATQQSASGPYAALLSDTATYLSMFWREFTPMAILLAAWGALTTLARRPGAGSYTLLLVFAANLVGAAMTVGFNNSQGYSGDLIEEGFILGCYFALSAWVALGATDVVGRIRAGMRARRFAALTAPAGFAAAGIMALSIVIPSLSSHWAVAHRDDHPFADRYSATVFGELPHGSALVVGGSDLNLPLEYRQIVYHERPDVLVVDMGGLRYGWYRRELGRRLGAALPPQNPDSATDVAQVARWLGRQRPVYLDLQATENLDGVIGFRTVGLVAQVVPGTKPQPIADPAAMQRRLAAVERAAGLPDKNANVWPTHYLLDGEYATLGLKVANAYYQHHDFTGMRSALMNVLDIEPDNPAASQDLAKLDQLSLGS